MDFKDLIKVSKVRRNKFSRIDLDKPDIGGGVYRMFDNSGEVVYVGKSVDLRRRVRQHLGKDTNSAYFIDEVKKIEWFTEPDPVYQHLLEAIYIAYHRPRYNDEVKDSKRKFGEDYDPTR